MWCQIILLWVLPLSSERGTIRQSRLDSSLGFQLKVVKTFQVFPWLLASGHRDDDERATHRRCSLREAYRRGPYVLDTSAGVLDTSLRVTCVSNNSPSVSNTCVQGYLAHKKHPPPRTLQ